MAVAFDASSVVSGQFLSNESWTHTPVGTPKGVLVFVVQDAGTGDPSDQVTSVTYGGATMTEVSLSPALGAGSRGAVHAFFLGSSIPTGAKTVAVTTPDTLLDAIYKYAICVTVTGAADTSVQSTVQIDSAGGTAANPSTTLGLSGQSCFVMEGFFSGRNAVTGITPFSGWTSTREFDFGPNTFGSYVYDTVGTSDVTVGFTALIDHYNLLAIAIKEVEATPVNTTDAVTPGLTESQASLISSGVSDTLLPGLTEVVALLKNPEFVSVTDALGISVTEALALVAYSSVTDTATPSLTELASLIKSPELISVTDSLSISISEALVLLVSSSVSDTLVPGISDSSVVDVVGGLIPVAVLDGLTPEITEATTTQVGLALLDTLTPSLTEAQTSVLYTAVSEALTLTLGETLGSVLFSSVTDVIPVSISESVSLLIAVTATETLTPSLTDAQTSLLYTTVSEVLALTLGETVGSALFSSVTDVIPVSISESVALLVVVTATDTLLVSITDSAGVVVAGVIAKIVADALTPYCTELGILEFLDAWTNQSAVVGVWTLSGSTSGSWTNEGTETGSWTAEGTETGSWTEDPPL